MEKTGFNCHKIKFYVWQKVFARNDIDNLKKTNTFGGHVYNLTTNGVRKSNIMLMTNKMLLCVRKSCEITTIEKRRIFVVPLFEIPLK